jgi:uncharacterized phiE125 gp8 family phage protein
MAGLDLVTPPASEPITLAEAKAHLRVDHADEDTLIEAYIAGARSSVEAVLKASLLETVWQYRIDGGFPREIRLPIGPVLTTNGLAVTYVDGAGAVQTLDPASYQASLGSTAVIRPAYALVWPVTRPELDAVRVTFRAGWPAAADLPAAVRAALLLMIGHLYANREAVIPAGALTELPLGVHNLLMPFVRFD